MTTFRYLMSSKATAHQPVVVVAAATTVEWAKTEQMRAFLRRHTHRLLSSSDDRTVRLWGMNVNQAIQRICTTTNALTPAKWKQYVSLDLPYRQPCQ